MWSCLKALNSAKAKANAQAHSQFARMHIALNYCYYDYYWTATSVRELIGML